VSHAGTWTTLAGLAGLAAFTWWLQAVTSMPASTNQTVGHVPDYTVEDFSLTAMNLEGRPYYRLKAPSMVRYADDHTAEVHKPELEFREKAGPPWNAVADQAWISADSSVVRLPGRVLITRAAAPGYDAVKILTSGLTIEPKARYATTKRNVQAWMGAHQLEGRGMKLHLLEARLELLSNVRGRYAVDR
jgi:lipopolysaccharide export system protein LptC